MVPPSRRLGLGTLPLLLPPISPGSVQAVASDPRRVARPYLPRLQIFHTKSSILDSGHAPAGVSLSVTLAGGRQSSVWCIKFASSVFFVHPNFMLGLDLGPNFMLGLDGLHNVCR